ncbi:hypothetical protein HZS_7877 [Henneguya salminicola]|nr:hypothetical protein HZS_7877 [Henneguya salminicola]
MAGRANNALKRYSRRFGQLFLNGHLNIAVFMMAIRAQFEFYSERCKQVRENEESIRYLEAVFYMPPICPEFLA